MLYNCNFFFYSTFIFLFWSADTIFSNLTKNAVKKFVIGKKILIIFFSCLKYGFWTKTIITFFLQIISLHKLHFCVSYEEIYEHKFQKFSIKTLVTVASPKCIKYHKIGLRALGVKG